MIPDTNKFVIPHRTLVIPARGFLSFSETKLDFALNAAGETIYFKNPRPDRVLDAVEFGASAKRSRHGPLAGRRE